MQRCLAAFTATVATSLIDNEDTDGASPGARERFSLELGAMTSHLHRNNADSDLAQHLYCQNMFQIARRVAQILAIWRKFGFWDMSSDGYFYFHSKNMEIKTILAPRIEML
jgi:hypothetical protein